MLNRHLLARQKRYKCLTRAVANLPKNIFIVYKYLCPRVAVKLACFDVQGVVAKLCIETDRSVFVPKNQHPGRKSAICAACNCYNNIQIQLVSNLHICSTCCFSCPLTYLSLKPINDDSPHMAPLARPLHEHTVTPFQHYVVCVER